MLRPRVAVHFVHPADLVLVAPATGQDLVVDVGQDGSPQLRHWSGHRAEQGVAAPFG